MYLLFLLLAYHLSFVFCLYIYINCAFVHFLHQEAECITDHHFLEFKEKQETMSMSMNCTSTASALRMKLALVSTSSSAVSVSPNCSSMMMMPFTSISIRAPKNTVRCEVANAVEESSSSSVATSTEKIGARVKVTAPVKVYHVPKVPDMELTGMEGEIKQYVGLWNGKRISANLPYKVQFVTDIQGRGPVKFFAHLKEDEFDYV
ncbi:hypothetical protein RJT34_27679 [Clitoria ternatea]|uniref:Ferredoxin thioredoxin reductase alpha chain domain-containing protein n=1 Tax=Clitoria ternatea TaxID=43366 RepID=A0AAN9FA77_CLITE